MRCRDGNNEETETREHWDGRRFRIPNPFLHSALYPQIKKLSIVEKEYIHVKYNILIHVHVHVCIIHVPIL